MKLTNVTNFIKHFCMIYAAIGIIPNALTKVMPLGILIMPKKFYEIDTCGQFHKTFKHNLCFIGILA